MSAATNSSLVYQNTARLTESESMLATGNVDISVTLRMDYNLRFTKQALYSYQRELNNNSFTVITSKVFQNKAAAKAAIELLPIQLLVRKPWVKPISSVISEINTFTR